MPDAPLVWKEGRSKTVYTMECWCFAGEVRRGGCWASLRVLQTCSLTSQATNPIHPTSHPVHMQSLALPASHCRMGFRTQKQSPPAQSRLDSLWSWPGFLYLSHCENTGNPASPILKYLPQEGRYIIFPEPLFCLCTSDSCFVNALQSKLIQTFLRNGMFKR